VRTWVALETTMFRVLYTLTYPLIAALRPLLPRYITTTQQMGRAC
jgi:hypothetical protein